jgi:hypothetical protein
LLNFKAPDWPRLHVFLKQAWGLLKKQHNPNYELLSLELLSNYINEETLQDRNAQTLFQWLREEVIGLEQWLALEFPLQWVWPEIQAWSPEARRDFFRNKSGLWIEAWDPANSYFMFMDMYELSPENSPDLPEEIMTKKNLLCLKFRYPLIDISIIRHLLNAVLEIQTSQEIDELLKQTLVLATEKFLEFYFEFEWALNQDKFQLLDPEPRHYYWKPYFRSLSTEQKLKHNYVFEQCGNESNRIIVNDYTKNHTETVFPASVEWNPRAESGTQNTRDYAIWIAPWPEEIPLPIIYLEQQKRERPQL